METLRVLVVDDEPGMRIGASARRCATSPSHVPDVDDEVGFEVDQAGAGEQALEMIAAGPARHAAAGPQAARHQRARRARTLTGPRATKC